MDLLTTTASSSWKALSSSLPSLSPSSPVANYNNNNNDKCPSGDDASSLSFWKSCPTTGTKTTTTTTTPATPTTTPTTSRPMSQSLRQHHHHHHQQQLTSPSSTLPPSSPILFLPMASTATLPSSQGTSCSRSHSHSHSDSYSGCTTPSHDDDDDDDVDYSPYHPLPTTTRTTTTTPTSPATAAVLHHARLDGSLHCCQCHASHALYLMYPIVKTFETWNHETQYQCALCHHDNDDNDDKCSRAPLAQEQEVAEEWERAPLPLPPPAPSTPMWTQNKNKDKDKSSAVTATVTALPNQKCRRPTSQQIQLIAQDSCDIQECLDLLHELEEERDKAMEHCSLPAIEELQHAMRRELLFLPPQEPAIHTPASHSRSRTASSTASSSSSSIETAVDRDTQIYIELWQRHWDLLAETVEVVQHALEVQGDEACDLLLAYYQWRARPLDEKTPTAEPAWRLSADRALNKRDLDAGVAPGHFWGSSSSSFAMATTACSATSERPPDSDSDIVEELASPEESLFIQLFVPHNRGLGWSNPACRPEAESSVAMYEAYATEENIKVVPRSEHFDRDLTNRDNAQHVKTLLIRIAEKKMATSPKAAKVLSSSPQQQQQPKERIPLHTMVTPTPVPVMSHHSRSRTTRKTLCPMEDEAFPSPPTNIRKNHRTKGSHKKVIHSSRRTSSSALVDVASTPKQRMGRIPSETNNKRVTSSRDWADETATSTSKRTKKVPIVSAIKASPKTLERGSLPNHSIAASTLATKSTVQRVPVTTTHEPCTMKRGRGRPRKYPKNTYAHSPAKHSDIPVPSVVAENVVTWTPTIRAPPGTPASCTRSVENRRKMTIFREEGDELRLGGYKSMSDLAGMTQSRAPRRCLRCVQFGGHMALMCKGRGGQQNCIFFTPKGNHAEN